MGKNKKRRRVKKEIRVFIRQISICLIVMIVMVFCWQGITIVQGHFQSNGSNGAENGIPAKEPEMDVQLLTVNPYSRPGTSTNKINAIVIHYTANPGSTAMQNRNYFEGLKDSHQTKASSHFVVGLEGEIVQCVPTWEEAYASNSRNADTVSIETCHPKEDGKYTEATYKSLVQLTAWLCQKFDLTEKDVIRHYDITEKNCPKYFVENEKAWNAFIKDVKNVLDRM